MQATICEMTSDIGGATIPVVDFSKCSLGVELKRDAAMEVARAMAEAFSRVGFVYLRHCGVSTDLLHAAFSSSREFFHLPPEIKVKYTVVSDTAYQGYVGLEKETLNAAVSAPGDLRENFNFSLATLSAPIWPTEVPQFKTTLVELFHECARLSERILKVVAYALGLDDPDYFSRCHNVSTMTRPVGSTLRTIYYPPVKRDAIKKGQTRLGEHTDWGTMSLIFQDDVGGLQVRGEGGQWFDARPIEGTVVLNIADLMQRWAADRFVSAAHRIVVPKDGDRKCGTRQSLAFFVHPDPETEIRCLNGSDRYEPVIAGEYLRGKFNETRAHRY